MLEKVKCLACEGKYYSIMKKQEFLVNDENVEFNYIQCPHCESIEEVEYINEKVKDLKAKILRYYEMKIDKDLIKTYKEKNKREMLKIKVSLKSNNIYLKMFNKMYTKDRIEKIEF